MPGSLPGRGLSAVSPTGSTYWQDARVLVVDDHYTYRLLMGSQLEKLRVAHHMCSNGQQALQALEDASFDLVISDCRMPVMDGYSLTCEWRRREQATGRASIPILALTGRLGPDEVRQCVACGMNGWLIKPIGLEPLREVLRYWLATVTAPAPRPRPPNAGEPGALPQAGCFPSRTSLIAAFGAWDVVEPMLYSLVREAREDLVVLDQALAGADALLTAQRLHRLVGSVAFLGAAGLELRATQLIDQVHLSGVSANKAVLAAFIRDVEHYLRYLADL